MSEGSSLKLIIEKGPREGETLKYSPGSSVKVGRVVRGNTVAIKDAGISSKHICIQFDNELSQWTLCDLDSSNGTFLNAQILKPHVPSGLNDGDCIKIGELTSIIVKIGVDSPIRLRRNPRRQVKPVAGSGLAAGVEKRLTELGLGFDEDLGGNEVNEAAEKRNLRGRGKKGVDLNNEVEILCSKRVLRSSKKNQITESLNLSVIEPKRTLGRKKVQLEPYGDLDLDEGKPVDIVVVGKRTRGGRKGLRVEPLENAQSSQVDESVQEHVDKLLDDRLENVKNSGLGENLDTNNESVIEHAEKLSEDHLENVKNSDFGENLDTNNESTQEHVENLVSPQKDCVGKEAMVDGCEGIVKDTGSDNNQWQDLEKMTLADFFDYMEVQLAKEIYEKSEKMIADLKETARKYHEFRLQRDECGKGKVVTD